MHSPAARPFVEFVLRNAQIKTNVCSRQKHEHGYTLAPRTVPDYNLIFVRRGKVVWVIGGKEFVLGPGDLVLVPPSVPHEGYSQARRITLGSIHVEVTLPGGQDVFCLLIPPPFRHVRPGTRLDDYLRGAVAEWDRGDETQTLLTMPGWARLIVLELLRHDAGLGLLTQRPIDPLVSKILDELNRRLSRATSLRDLAERSGYSPQHLNRLFRRVLGVTPLQYLTRMRMERAAALLAEGRLTVSAVAGSLGYDDPYYFSRLFRQHHGRSPAHYREAIGSNSPSARS